MKRVTAVLPVRNCRQELKKCLSDLGRSSYIPRIIVVDDGSDDGTRQMLREQWPHVTYLPLSAHTGYAHAANAGLRLVQTENAFLVRPGMGLRIGRKCIAELLEAMVSDVFCTVPACCDTGGSMCAGNRRGTKRREQGRIRGDEGIFFPELAAGKRKQGPAAEVIAVPDGCAMYRMRTLEEIGWLDERHFDGLEAFDLSLRAALSGWKTVRVPGAHIRTAAGKTGERADLSTAASGTFRRQLAAGNGLYVFYKNIPSSMRILGFPMFALTDLAQLSAFLRRGEFGAYRMAVERGKALCSLEKDRRTALDEGVSLWPENLSDASFLGMDEAAEQIYPLFLAEKGEGSLRRFARYAHVQKMLALQLAEMIRLLAY